MDTYSQAHPNVKFEAVPSGWDGYFDKLATQAASGAMPDIVQMDYLYITTYAKNNSLADLQPYIDDGTIDVSHIDPNILDSGKIDGKMNGLVLSSSYQAIPYFPVFSFTVLHMVTKSSHVQELSGSATPASENTSGL